MIPAIIPMMSDLWTCVRVIMVRPFRVRDTSLLRCTNRRGRSGTGKVYCRHPVLARTSRSSYPSTMSLRPSSFRLALTGLLVLAFQTGCLGPQRPIEGVWPWVPTEVEFHRLSRFIDREGVELISLRVEFLDVDGDPVKFAGTVLFKIEPESTLRQDWRFNFDLSNLEVNAVHWDHVTSTYRFEFEVGWDDPPLPDTSIQVQISADSPETGLLEAEIMVRRGD